MNKRVLAIYFSQSGQLKEMIDNFFEPLVEAGAEVEKVRIHLQEDFLFPWTTERFFGVMPDCVNGVTRPVQPFTLQHTSYDLVVLGYQAWFLSPSIPFNSLMQLPVMHEVLKNTPVITITGCRNMWVNAFGKVKTLVSNTGANHVATIALADRHLNLVSIFTIFHWMLKGAKTRYLNFFPLPGVSQKDIDNVVNYGITTLPHLQNNDWNGLKEKLIAQDAVALKHHLMFMEGKAGIMFNIWAKVIARKKNKKSWLVAFKYYLLIALFIFAPIVFLVDLLIFKPFFSRHVRKKKEACLKLN